MDRDETASFGSMKQVRLAMNLDKSAASWQHGWAPDMFHNFYFNEKFCLILSY